MVPEHSDSKDKEITKKFFARTGIDARDYPKNTGVKAVDFILFLGNILWGYSEIKAIVDYEFLGLRNDPTYNKIQNKIHEAAKQFSSSNPLHEHPNIIVFVNHTSNVGFQDLWTVITGSFLPPGTAPKFIDPTYLKRLIGKEDLKEVDHFIWIDKPTKRVYFARNENSPYNPTLTSQIGLRAYEDWDELVAF